MARTVRAMDLPTGRWPNRHPHAVPDRTPATSARSGKKAFVRLQVVRALELYQRHVLAVPEPNLSGVREKLEKIAMREDRTEASARPDAAQRSSGSLIEVTDHKMLVGLIDPNEPAILPQIRKLMTTRHYAARTERSYTVWAWQFAQFAGGWDKPASTVIESEVRDFLSKLAVKDRVAASTQNQALNALLFLFRDVLGHEFAGTQSATGVGPTVTRTGSG